VNILIGETILVIMSTQRIGFLIDMDGVIHKAGKVIPGADVFVNNIAKQDIPFFFLTNNSRHTPIDMVTRLKRIGIKVHTKNIFTSAMATAMFLSSQKPKGTAYVLGEGGLLASLNENGYSVVDHDPDYVVVGEGRTLNLEMVEKAIDFILDGAKLIATNLDPSPKIKGWMKPGTGAIVAMLEEATGKKAFTVGKPSPVMMRAARKALGMATSETVVIGDTMETDILGGVQIGYKTVLVLSGSSSAEQLKDFAYKPDLVVESIADLSIDMFLKKQPEEQKKEDLVANR
jgi:NagD protein